MTQDHARNRRLTTFVAAVVLCACATNEPEVGPVASPDQAELTVEEKLELAREVRSDLYSELIAVDPGLLQEHAALLEVEGVRVNRILNRGLIDYAGPPRGGGAYFSFTTLTNDYDQEPDLELQAWCFLSGFYGGNWGHVVRLEADSLLEVDLADLDEGLRADEPPPRRRTRPEQVVAGAVYAVRSIRLEESDILVALQILDRDDYGVTFAWRILGEYAVPSLR